MAKADYYLCDVCGEKCFYDANLNYEIDPKTLTRTLDYMGEMAAICDGCVKTHTVKVVQREASPRPDGESPVPPVPVGEPSPFFADARKAADAVNAWPDWKAGETNRRLRSPSPEPPAPDVREGLRAQAQAWLDEWECMQPHEAPRHRDGYRFVVRLLSALSQPVPPAQESREALDRVIDEIRATRAMIARQPRDVNDALGAFDYCLSRVRIARDELAALRAPAEAAPEQVHVSVTPLHADPEDFDSPVESVDLFLRGRGISLLINVRAGNEASYSYEVEGQEKGRGMLGRPEDTTP
jgi:hypothetical protein